MPGFGTAAFPVAESERARSVCARSSARATPAWLIRNWAFSRSTLASCEGIGRGRTFPCMIWSK
jgi:hypothetical protein